MRFKRHRPEDLSSLCDQPGEDDGVDPRDTPGSSRRKNELHKTRRLCTEAAITIAAVLAGEFHDAILRELVVVSVVPAPNARRLLVSVRLPPTGGPATSEEILARLGRIGGRLRSEVAAAVLRKRAPELSFTVVASGEVEG